MLEIKITIDPKNIPVQFCRDTAKYLLSLAGDTLELASQHSDSDLDLEEEEIITALREIPAEVKTRKPRAKKEIAPVPPAPPAPPAPEEVLTYVQLSVKIGEKISTGNLTREKLLEVLASEGLKGLSEIAGNPHLVPVIAKKLGF